MYVSVCLVNISVYVSYIVSVCDVSILVYVS